MKFKKKIRAFDHYSHVLLRSTSNFYTVQIELTMNIDNFNSALVIHKHICSQMFACVRKRHVRVRSRRTLPNIAEREGVGPVAAAPGCCDTHTVTL